MPFLYIEFASYFFILSFFLTFSPWCISFLISCKLFSLPACSPLFVYLILASSTLQEYPSSLSIFPYLSAPLEIFLTPHFLASWRCIPFSLISLPSYHIPPAHSVSSLWIWPNERFLLTEIPRLDTFILQINLVKMDHEGLLMHRNTFTPTLPPSFHHIHTTMHSRIPFTPPPLPSHYHTTIMHTTISLTPLPPPSPSS